MANIGKVWKYINSDLFTKLELLKLPELLSLTEVNTLKATLSTLDKKEKDLYKLLLVVYKEETAKTMKIIKVVIWRIGDSASGNKDCVIRCQACVAALAPCCLIVP